MCSSKRNRKRKRIIDMMHNNNGIPNYEEFERILRMSQTELKDYVLDKLIDLGYSPHSGDGFLYAKGDVDILLTAHLDTTPKVNGKKRIAPLVITTLNGEVSSPQGIGGDDRCGVYMILEIARETRCSVLFCEDEESGCVGSYKFTKETDLINEVSKVRYIIELDRKGNQDLVFYSCDNQDFEDWLLDNMSGYKTSWGSCSDISELMPASGVAGVNISVGYYDEHTLEEKIVLAEMENTLSKVKELVKLDSPRFEYIEEPPYCKYDYYDTLYGYLTDKSLRKTDDIELYVEYERNGNVEYAMHRGSTFEEAFMDFFFEHSDVSMDDILDYYY